MRGNMGHRAHWKEQHIAEEKQMDKVLRQLYHTAHVRVVEKEVDTVTENEHANRAKHQIQII